MRRWGLWCTGEDQLKLQHFLIQVIPVGVQSLIQLDKCRVFVLINLELACLFNGSCKIGHLHEFSVQIKYIRIVHNKTYKAVINNHPCSLYRDGVGFQVV